MTKQELVSTAATIENAREWSTESEQYLFAERCLDNAGMTSTITDNPDFVDSAVEALEIKFEEMLK